MPTIKVRGDAAWVRKPIKVWDGAAWIAPVVPSISGFNWALSQDGTSCVNQRKYNFGWTPAGLIDGVDSVQVDILITGGVVNTATNTNPSAAPWFNTMLAGCYLDLETGSLLQLSYAWRLYVGGVLTQSGSGNITPKVIIKTC